MEVNEAAAAAVGQPTPASVTSRAEGDASATAAAEVHAEPRLKGEPPGITRTTHH